MKSVELKVSGMSCNHCVRAVEDAINGVAGAKATTVQIGKATVEVEDSVATGDLIDAVSDAGYVAQEA